MAWEADHWVKVVFHGGQVVEHICLLLSESFFLKEKLRTKPTLERLDAMVTRKGHVYIAHFLALLPLK